MRILFAILCFMLVGCYNAADESRISHHLPNATTTVANMRRDIVGAKPHLINHDMVIVGNIISSDRDDNFYRSIVVDDGTGAIEVMMGIAPLAADYPEGLRVALCMEGCCVSYQRGVMVVGVQNPDYESYDIGYLASREAVDRVVVRGDELTLLEPRAVNISELTLAECGRLVRIDSLHLVASTSIDTLYGEVLGDACWRGYSLFKSKSGDSIAVYTRDYARFAEGAIPLGEVSLSGIVEWAKYNGGRECYHLKMRYAEDCIEY